LRVTVVFHQRSALVAAYPPLTQSASYALEALKVDLAPPQPYKSYCNRNAREKHLFNILQCS
jgi:hypothetical protein